MPFEIALAGANCAAGEMGRSLAAPDLETAGRSVYELAKLRDGGELLEHFFATNWLCESLTVGFLP